MMKSPQLEYLTANDWVLIGDHAKRVTFLPRQMLIRAALPTEAVFVIVSGTARVEVGGKQIASLGAGAVCGEMGFLDGRPASASVVAETEVEAERLPAGKLREIFDTFPSIGHRFYKSIAVNLSKRLRDTSSALAEKNKGSSSGSYTAVADSAKKEPTKE
jgi:CRP-like cAMP-binding protein